MWPELLIVIEQGPNIEKEFSWDEQGRLLVPLGRREIPLNVRLLPVPAGEAPQPVADIDLILLRSRGPDRSLCFQPGEKRLLYELRVYGRLLRAEELDKSLANLERQDETQPQRYWGEEELLRTRKGIEKRNRERRELEKG